jgi:galactonate dehydratase
MKITRLSTYRIPLRWMLLKIETDTDIVGWGDHPEGSIAPW